MHRPALLLLFALALPCFTQAADLTSLADEAIEAFEPVTEEQLAESRRLLLVRSAELSAAVNQLPDHGDGWREYLKWNAVDELANAEATPSFKDLRASLALLNSGADGLELPVFRNAHAALRRYLDLLAIQSRKDQAAYYQQLINQVVRLTELDPTGGDPRYGSGLEQRLDLLAGIGQADRLLSAIRGANYQPNVQLSVSESLLDRLVRRPVNSSSPISDRILGARVVGTGQTTAELSLNLRPSFDAALVDFRLMGNVHSETTSYKGPAAIRSSADTPISGVKTVRLTPDAFYLLPASATAKTRSRTRSVRKVGGGFGSRIVEKIARQRAAEQRGQADRISSGRAADKVAASLDERIDDSVVRLRREYDKMWTKPLDRYGAGPQRSSLHSSDTTLNASLLQADRGQFGADSSPPPAPAADMVARLHPSAVQNLATTILGGATISKAKPEDQPKLSARLPEWLSGLLPERPAAPTSSNADEPVNDSKFKPWKLTLRGVRPLSVLIDEGSVVLKLHADEILSGDSSYKKWDVILRYQPVLAEGNWGFERQGQIEVLPTNQNPKKRLSRKNLSVRGIMMKTLNRKDAAGKGFAESLKLEPIDLSDRDLGSLSWLTTKQVDLSGGWLTIAWDAL